jgi:hypothetical protein
MLMKTDVIYQGTSPPQESARYVSGQYLAKNGLNARDRARLAVGIKAERVTVRQVARLCRVSVPYVTDALRPPAKPESLAERFARSTPDEWRECARTIGPAKVWDHMIMPLM